MSENIKQIEELKKGLNAAFIDKEADFNHAYLPQLLSNNPKENKKVLPVVEKELSTCEEFCMYYFRYVTKCNLKV